MEIFVAKNGSRTGPFSEEQTRSMLAAGMVSKNDLAWTAGEKEWKPISSLPCWERLVPKEASSSPPRFDADTQDTELKGVGGWLLFFCISLTILTPLIAFGYLIEGWEQVGPASIRFPFLKVAMLWENVWTVAVTAYGMYVGCKIWSGDPHGRRMAKAYLLLSLFGLFGATGVTRMLLEMSGVPSAVTDAAEADAVKSLARQLVYFLVWWFYFEKSKRVRNTYGAINQPHHP